eukprot:GHVT01045344.1.p1 GENE.GHVT01045344.1~~GHVT01045344.1.p1  ORF type:complete len:390 (+),score=52.91 GHVT01045344.1:316-1485(+)
MATGGGGMPGPGAAEGVEIESSDVIRLILQFFQEHGLHRSLQTLQEESRVTLDAVDSLDRLVADCHSGRWDRVLHIAAASSLPEDLLHNLYEHVVCELLELREVDLARALLRETAALQSLKLHQPSRFKRLELLASRAFFDPKEAYQGIPREKRRDAIAQAMAQRLTAAPPSRLLALIGLSLKYQQQEGMLPSGRSLCLLTDTATKGKEQKELYPQTIAKTIQFGKNSYPECALFSSDGQYLITGSVDGFVEVWNWQTGQLNKELEYQRKEELMMHTSPVVALAVSRDSAILASADSKGVVKVWRISQGTCVRKFDKAHDGAITSIVFSRDSLHLLTASFDNTARIHGLKSGKTLKEFRGHAAFVNSAVYTCMCFRYQHPGFMPEAFLH